MNIVVNTWGRTKRTHPAPPDPASKNSQASEGTQNKK